MSTPEAHGDRTWLLAAYDEASFSKDPSTQNGAVLVDGHDLAIANGHNRFPYGVLDLAERWERPLKYEVIEHAERNAIYQAARGGYRTLGTTMYCPWAACADCARAIIQAGIYRLVRHDDAMKRSRTDAGIAWNESISIADQMLNEAGVLVTNVEGPITNGLVLRHAGEEWTP